MEASGNKLIRASRSLVRKELRHALYHEYSSIFSIMSAISGSCLPFYINISLPKKQRRLEKQSQSAFCLTAHRLVLIPVYWIPVKVRIKKAMQSSDKTGGSDSTSDQEGLCDFNVLLCKAWRGLQLGHVGGESSQKRTRSVDER